MFAPHSNHQPLKNKPMKFKACLSDPFLQGIIELGEKDAHQLIETFEGIEWASFLEQMGNQGPDNLEYAPTLEFTNLDNYHELTVSMMMEVDKAEFSVIYIRPKVVKKFLGLIKSIDDNYLTCAIALSKKEVVDCIKAFSKNDDEYLELKIQ